METDALTHLVDLDEDESVHVVVHEAGHPALPGLVHVAHQPGLGGQSVEELSEAARAVTPPHWGEDRQTKSSIKTG